MLTRFSRLMIVDDSDVMLSIVTGMFRGIGFDNIHSTNDGSEALDRLQNERFALIVSDWCMEPISGSAIFQEVRRRGPNINTPFLIMTNFSVKFAGVARERGLINYLTKPFTAKTLQEKIHAVCAEYTA